MPESSPQSIAVELKGLTKVFKTVVANDGVNLRVESGTIHGVIGENGAGKSTAMKMLYGLYSPDSGEIFVRGQARRWSSPQDAIRAGIGMVHQHFMLAGPYTALENILVGAESLSAGGFGGPLGVLASALRPIQLRRARNKLEKLADQYGLSVPWDKPVEELAVGVQQRIEILKLLYRDADVLILDEPTAVLTPQEVQELFTNLRKLKAEGKTILIITHKLKEVMALTDRVTVFRAGKVTGEIDTARTTPQELADLMVGRSVLLEVEVPPQPELGAAALSCEDLCLDGPHGDRVLNQISIQVRSGEVVGIAGVEGNGQSELLRAVQHPSDPGARSSGRVSILGHDVSDWTAAEIKELGVGVIPEDRHKEGLLLESEMEENFLLGLQRSAGFSKRGLVDRAALRSRTAAAMEEYDVRPRTLSVEAGRLSGGNQQKLIIAREFERKPKLLIAAQPTRGVDVGAIEFIHKRILRARTEGAGVLLVSSELDEVLGLSDRVLVIYEGAIVGEFTRANASEKEIGVLMGGGKVS